MRSATAHQLRGLVRESLDNAVDVGRCIRRFEFALLAVSADSNAYFGAKRTLVSEESNAGRRGATLVFYILYVLAESVNMIP